MQPQPLLVPGSRGWPERARPHFLPRGGALFLGAFTWVNLLGGSLAPGLDANLLWVDLRFVPVVIAKALLAAGACALLGFALAPRCSAWRRSITLTLVLALAAAALINCVQFYVLWARGNIRPAIPAPLSSLWLILICWVGVSVWRPAEPAGRARELLAISGLAACFALVFPLLQMMFFGKTDYRRTADAAVVFGARAYADGRPSDALADRVRTACDLYRRGTVRKLIFSGGPGDGAVHETESMKRMAIRLGVDPKDILVDRGGLNTRATVKNTEPLFQDLGSRKVLVVSHFYHLPRIKLTYQRDGREVYTVPARESYFLRQLPFNMLREVVAFWAYYLRPLPRAALGRL